MFPTEPPAPSERAVYSALKGSARSRKSALKRQQPVVVATSSSRQPPDRSAKATVNVGEPMKAPYIPPDRQFAEGKDDGRRQRVERVPEGVEDRAVVVLGGGGATEPVRRHQLTRSRP